MSVNFVFVSLNIYWKTLKNMCNEEDPNPIINYIIRDNSVALKQQIVSNLTL